MIPIDQRVFDATGGDCLAACVASVLELPAEAVPNFMEGLPDWDASGGDDSALSLEWTRAFFRALNDWLAPRGLAYFEVGHAGGLPEHLLEALPPGYWIAVGETVAGTGSQHCVVMRGREMVHDPSPRRAGLERLCAVGLLVALDPARPGGAFP